MKRIIAMAVLAAFATQMVGCSGCSQQPQQQAPVQAAAPAAAGPVIVNNNQGGGAGEMLAGAAVGAAAGLAIGTLMSNGQRYDGHNWQGPPPAGYDVDPKTHTVTKVIVKEKTIIKEVPAAQAPVQPVNSPIQQSNNLKKVANPGDAAAEAEKAKMAQEAQAKAQAEQKRKDDLKARRASLEKNRATNNNSGFKELAAKEKKK